jgi:hypothetical protein
VKKPFIISLILLVTATMVMIQLIQRQAFGQQAAAPDCPLQLQAMGGELTDMLQGSLQWRLKAIEDEQKIAELQAEIAKLKATDPKKK